MTILLLMLTRWFWCISGIKYNAEKEEKAKQEAKQKKLQHIEEIKKAEAEKCKLLVRTSLLKQLFLIPASTPRLV